MIKLQEHEKRKLPEYKELILRKYVQFGETNGKQLKNIAFLGLDYHFRSDEFQAGYYVGIDWIDKEKDIQLMVRPKNDSVDFQTMFMHCFTSNLPNNNLENIFYIRTDDKLVKVPANVFQLTPLLLIYFLSLVRNIVLTGLRRDYVFREENLSAKIKGKILLSKYAKCDVAQNRIDKAFCRYQEYDIDCLDNRILKKALLVVNRFLNENRGVMRNHCERLREVYDYCMPAFEKVSSEVSIQELKSRKASPLYRQYIDALRIAKMIILKQSYWLDQNEDSSEQYFPPFIINMPLLFELYAFSMLKERYGDKIRYHEINSYGNELDFSKKDENLIIDAKYIFEWSDKVNHHNIRQLSGYARNKSIRGKLEIPYEHYICPCLIIYPDENGCETDSLSDVLFDSGADIETYLKFKRLGLKLPKV